MDYIRARRNFSGGTWSTKGWLVNGVAAWGVPGVGAPPQDAREVFKMCKKSMKIYNFFENLKGIISIFKFF